MLFWLLTCCEPSPSKAKYLLLECPILEKRCYFKIWNATFERCAMVTEDEFGNAQHFSFIVWFLGLCFFSSEGKKKSKEIATRLVGVGWARYWQLLMCIKDCCYRNSNLLSLAWEACHVLGQHQMGAGYLILLLDLSKLQQSPLTWVAASLETKMTLYKL